MYNCLLLEQYELNPNELQTTKHTNGEPREVLDPSGLALVDSDWQRLFPVSPITGGQTGDGMDCSVTILLVEHVQNYKSTSALCFALSNMPGSYVTTATGLQRRNRLHCNMHPLQVLCDPSVAALGSSLFSGLGWGHRMGQGA